MAGGDDGVEEVVVFLERLDVGVGGLDLLGRAEEEAGLGGSDHLQVVVAVAGGYGVHAAAALETMDGVELGVSGAELVADHVAVGVHLHGVVEERWPAELAHEGAAKDVEGVRDYDHLRRLAELVEELARAIERLDGVDHVDHLVEG